MEEHMVWYKKLSINQKINLKDTFYLLCGTSWSELSILFDLNKRIEIAYYKLIREFGREAVESM